MAIFDNTPIDYNAAVDAQTAKGAVVVDAFTGTATSDYVYFGEGEIIVLPKKYQVLRKAIDPTAKPVRYAEYIMVEVLNEDGTHSRYQPFYPSQLSKRINEITLDDNGNHIRTIPAKPRKPGGDAAQLYQSFSSRLKNDAFKAVHAKGKAIKVTKAIPMATLRYGTSEVTTTAAYDFEFCDIPR